MLRSIWILPLIYRVRMMTYLYKPFVFPEGCHPNINNSSTFENIVNETTLQIEIDNMMNYTLVNESMIDEVHIILSTHFHR